MSEAKNEGGFAYPFHYDIGGPYPNYRSGPGMTLRDYFAGQAMIGLTTGYDATRYDVTRSVAIHAYELADAMISERRK